MLSLAEFVKEKRNEVKLTQEDLKINQCRSPYWIPCLVGRQGTERLLCIL